MRIVPLVLLVACGGSEASLPEPSPPAYDFTADKSFAELEEAVLACGRTACRASSDAAAARACLDEHCPVEASVWSVVPSRIRYDEGAVFVSASVEHTPTKVAGEVVPRGEPVFVGVTVIRDDGEEVNLSVTTLFPDGLDMPVTLSADVGEGVQDIVIGAWSTKIQPCDVNRSGCRDFGFVLDDSLATWPPHFYRDWYRQRIPPSPLELVLVGGDSMLERTAREAMSSYLEVFDTEVEARRADGAAESSRVLHRHTSDVLMAKAVAAALAKGGIEAEVEHRAEAKADLVVEIAKP